MRELAGYVLDEIIYETNLAQASADLIEGLYQEATAEVRELLQFGLIEDMCIILHAIWDKKNEYQNKKDILMRYIGPNTKAIFNAVELERSQLFDKS